MLQRIEGSSGTHLQVINLQVQLLEQKRRKWQKIKDHKKHCPEHIGNALSGLPELAGRFEEYIYSNSSKGRDREMLLVLFS